PVIFLCSPTRRSSDLAFTVEGTLRLRNACHKRDSAPIESDCQCYACRHFSRGYLHHLFLTNEMLGPILLALHNVAFYCRLMEKRSEEHTSELQSRVDL